MKHWIALVFTTLALHSSATYAQGIDPDDLFPSDPPPFIDFNTEPVIPEPLVDGDYSDALQALTEAYWEQYGDDFVSELQSTFPLPFDIADSASDYASDHPILSTGIAIGAGIGSDLLAEEFLDEYGEMFGVDSIPIPIPDYEIGNATIWPFEFPVDISISGDVEINAVDPDWYQLYIEFTY